MAKSSSHSGFVLIDSNVYITSGRHYGNPIAKITEHIDLENVVSCGVIHAEVLRGIKSPKANKTMRSFFEVTINVPTINSIWERVATLAWKLDRQGRILPLQDIVIAICAMEAGASVLTYDKHFKQIPGLSVITPEF